MFKLLADILEEGCNGHPDKLIDFEQSNSEWKLRIAFINWMDWIVQESPLSFVVKRTQKSYGI